jgi:hypothetical protein
MELLDTGVPQLHWVLVTVRVAAVTLLLVVRHVFQTNHHSVDLQVVTEFLVVEVARFEVAVVLLTFTKLVTVEMVPSLVVAVVLQELLHQALVGMAEMLEVS